VEADYELEAVTASESIAEALQIRVGAPIFQIERTSMTSGNKPVDYEVLSYRGDLVRFVTKLRRDPGNVAGTRTLRSRGR
jgi:GntR family transcriptional regulator